MLYKILVFMGIIRGFYLIFIYIIRSICKKNIKESLKRNYNLETSIFLIRAFIFAELEILLVLYQKSEKFFNKIDDFLYKIECKIKKTLTKEK